MILYIVYCLCVFCEVAQLCLTLCNPMDALPSKPLGKPYIVYNRLLFWCHFYLHQNQCWNVLREQIFLWRWWERISLKCRRPRFDPWIGKIPQRREWQSTPVLLPGESHRQRSLVDYSPWGGLQRVRDDSVCVP